MCQPCCGWCGRRDSAHLLEALSGHKGYGNRMRVRLFAKEPPGGRCLMLAHKLVQATALTPSECLALADRLFALGHRQKTPALVEITDPVRGAGLAIVCAEFEILVETVS